MLTRLMGIKYSMGGEEAHKLGELGVKRVRLWLDGTTRFRIDKAIYELGPQDEPPMGLRVPQIGRKSFERFDLVGETLDESGAPHRSLFVECKRYRSAGNQAGMYREYLVVCYSALVSLSEGMGGVSDTEFMWATTHPFAQRDYMKLTSVEFIQRACSEHASRLGGKQFDPKMAQVLSERLWLSIVNPRVEEMMPGMAIRGFVAAKYATRASR
jgi:hypothetical protein